MTVVDTIKPETLALRSQLDEMLDQIATVQDPNTLTEVRARIEAARAWAKIHKATADLRLSLLSVEVEALVRIIELDAGDMLSQADRKAAEFLAEMSPSERENFVRGSGTATTAAGMVRSHLRDEELTRLRAESVAQGVAFARSPGSPNFGDSGAYTRNVSSVLREVVDDYTREGAPFSVAQMADGLIADAAIGDAVDPDVAEGIREVCRKAIRSAPVVKLGDTILPRLVTARTPDGDYVRIPVENAQILHLADMVEIRREQLAQDSAALEGLESVLDRLRRLPGSADDSRIGELVKRDLMESR